jgi:hypothetical protein
MTDYVVRPADLERDRDAVVAVWARNLRSHDSAAHAAKYDWYYRQNPLGPGRLWVLEAGAGGPVVGTSGLGLRRLCVGGKLVMAGVASDFAVDVAHRVLRPAMSLQKGVIASMDGGGIGVIYGLPNEKSLPVFKRLGYNADVGMSRFVKVLRVERFLRAKVKVGIARRALAGLADLGLRIASRETRRPTRAGVLTELGDFDARFDELWDRTKSGFEIAGERTSAFLRWRYARCPLRRYRVLALTRDGGGADDLLGYAVCTAGTDEQVTLIDLWAGNSPGLRDDLLAGVIGWARSQRAASVASVVAGVRFVEEGLLGFGFRPRGSGPMVAVNPPEAAPQAKWYFTLGDEDYN